ncbi:GNAT family N-acetyltransferase [Candidatus Woesearchaeota archaeon]|nr:GNAT family N-acetyltransferase [Candidatus Woesearchaeota archaeon]MCF7901061.1 GNAT family N-acetyltransferase [Candidatus Woesearchaeota archaeon]MCF8013612.1 GNAT family N-acetyltransferase [Candidatus Woesearchaeota archaeon]
MDVQIREGTEKDFSQILGMIKELALFEKAPEKVINTVKDMNNEKEYFKTFVAETNNKEIVGVAVYFFAYYTWVGKSLYLDDLYVKSDFRGKKIGTELLKEIFKIAEKENCKRIRWQVLNWNEPAIKFYKKIGAELDNEWINCDFDQKAIKKFNENKK